MACHLQWVFGIQPKSFKDIMIQFRAHAQSSTLLREQPRELALTLRK